MDVGVVHCVCAAFAALAMVSASFTAVMNASELWVAPLTMGTLGRCDEITLGMRGLTSEQGHRIPQLLTTTETILPSVISTVASMSPCPVRMPHAVYFPSCQGETRAGGGAG